MIETINLDTLPGAMAEYLDTLPGAMAEYKELLGKEFVAGHLETYATRGLKEAEAKRINVSAHPLAPLWMNLCSEVDRSLLDVRLQLSATSIGLLAQLHCIQIASLLSASRTGSPPCRVELS